MSVRGVGLQGMEAVSLADYLCALGVLRAVATQADPGATLAWRQGVPILDSTLSGENLVGWLSEEFTPSPIISPWNAGSGFNGNGKSKEAERTLAAVEETTDPRLGPLREAVAVGRTVVAEGRARGWAGGTMWSEKHKTSLLTLCRNRLPENALPWLDAAFALDLEDVSYNPLAGTGGNFRRQELSAGYLQQVLNATLDAHGRSLAWARSTLTGVEGAPYLRGAVGQYDPGRVGGIHSSVFEKLDDAGFINPWRVVLTCEGLLLFASSVARRNHATGLASPFVVRSTPYGYSTAADENGKGEFWAPLWERPARLSELEQLLGEGRAQYRGRQARNGFDFARAAGSLGVDRNITAFRRFVIVERLGQNPLAARAGDVPVGPRARQLTLLNEAFDWVERLRGPMPAGVASLARRAKASMFALAAGTAEPDVETAVFVRRFGQLHEAVARSSQMRGKTRPFQPRERPSWRPAWLGGELSLAAALASLSHRPGGPPALRPLLTRCTNQPSRRLAWSQGAPPSGVDLDGATLPRALAAAHQHRLWEVAAQAADQGAMPSVSYATATQAPPGSGLVQDFLDGLLDDQLLAELLRGLLILGWRTTVRPPVEETPDPPLRTALATLLPFYGDALPLMRSQLHPERAPFSPVLRPRPDWANRLRAGRIEPVLADARNRLRQAHCPPIPTPRDLPTLVDGTRLAATLLIPAHTDLRARALTQVSVTARLPRPYQQKNHQQTKDAVS
ncbi:type I-G CRISPR-associated protein Cas8g1/Csx17 [Streptomyces profundus]|uniref:type I-G CRISPR-associated protein Cas8g1/Csx17 n=1 Tax=Streptomyces profundus TaxID=2867410 RepID=UPI001D1678E9|nr:type I-U CRISPR-associated protein Csx17 [Streptomyces sp. MA3_2.13]UED86308.1 type I-U CRISPR-associated protein Csx17 [Streptomyces sp. MA3_2.13]